MPQLDQHTVDETKNIFEEKSFPDVEALVSF